MNIKILLVFASMCTHTLGCIYFCNCFQCILSFLGIFFTYITRCTRGVRVFFSVTIIRSSNSVRMNKFDFTTEKIGSVHMTVFEIVAHCNVDNWIQLLT